MKKTTYQGFLRYSLAGWNSFEYDTWTCAHQHASPGQAAVCAAAEARRLTRYGRGTPSFAPNIVTDLHFSTIEVLPS
jgi:hypothetical protein